MGKPQARQHGLRRGELGVVIQVRVDIRRRAEIAVPQPFLNLLHRDAVGQQEAGAGVPKIMQTDDAQVVLFENPLEAVRQRVRLQPFPDLVHADVVQIVRAVGAPAEPAVVLLLLFLMEQQLPELRHQRERPHAGLRLGRIRHNFDVPAVKVARRDGKDICRWGFTPLYRKSERFFLSRINPC